MHDKYKIYVASDYRGYQFRQQVLDLLRGHHDFVEVIDMGCDTDEQNDYNDYAISVAREVKKEKTNFGVLICGSAHGMTIQANRFKGIRACNCASTESAKLAREHENANILCLSSELTKQQDISDILYAFFHTQYTSTDRRDARIARLDEEEND